MASTLILCIYKKRKSSRATHSWFTGKMNSSSTNLPSPDWRFDACSIKLNGAVLSVGGRLGSTSCCGWWWDGDLLSAPLCLLLRTSCIARVLVCRRFRAQLWLTALFACSVSVSAYHGNHLLFVIMGLPPFPSLCVNHMSTPGKFAIDRALWSFLSVSRATWQQGHQPSARSWVGLFPSTLVRGIMW